MLCRPGLGIRGFPGLCLCPWSRLLSGSVLPGSRHQCHLSAFPCASGQSPTPEGRVRSGGRSEGSFMITLGSLGNKGMGAACMDMQVPFPSCQVQAPSWGPGLRAPRTTECCFTQGSWVLSGCPEPPFPGQLWPRDAEEQRLAPASRHPVKPLVAMWLGEQGLPSRPPWSGRLSSPL